MTEYLLADVEEEADQVRLGHRRERRGRRRHLGRREDGQQVLPGRLGDLLGQPLRLRREVLGDQQQSRDVLRALEIAPHPVERVGDAREHQASPGRQHPGVLAAAALRRVHDVGARAAGPRG